MSRQLMNQIPLQPHFQNVSESNSMPYDQTKVMEIHTELKQDELAAARLRLDKIDDNNDSLDLVISALMLREGIDRKNISVVVLLRANEADLLLEQ